MLRVAWIFKTESIIVPIFLGLITTSSFAKGCLPFLSRAGLTLSQLWIAPTLRRAPRKKLWLVGFCVGMGAPFLTLAALWRVDAFRVASWFPLVFLGLYFLFYLATGMAQNAFGALQGKLIRPARRGWLMAVSGIAGSTLAITAAFCLLRPWLELEPAISYQLIFGFAGCGFMVAAAVVWALYEPAVVAPETPPRNRLLQTYDVFRHDSRFRRLAYAAWLHMSMLLLFPHYASLLKTRFELEPFDIFMWVVVQNASAGLFSLLAGTLADMLGNRLSLQIQMFAAIGTPLLTLLLSTMDLPVQFTWLTFIALGLTPVVFKTLSNYVLELAPPEDHPRYLSALSLTLAAPYLLLAVLVGIAIDFAGHGPVFCTMAGIGLCGAIATFWLDEPRGKKTSVQNAER